MAEEWPITGKLTKRFYLGLDPGLFLVSGVGDSPRQRAFAEYVAPHEERQEQWARIREAMADQRNCDVFPTADEFEADVDRWHGRD